MPLTAPELDDRQFNQLVEEARQRIPRFTPEWTNFNDSDPGMTLVKLHAWLTETILFRLNQLPELNYIKFLNLLNIQPRPAVAAKAQLSFKLKKLNDPSDPLVVLIPINTQVGVDDPELEQELIFETDRTLTALNAALAMVIKPGAAGLRELVTEYDAAAAETKFPHPFYPFGSPPAANACCLIGVMLRPFRKNKADYSLDRFPAGELDLTVFTPEVFEKDAAGADISGPMSMECLFPWQAQALTQNIAWEAYYGINHSADFTNTSDATIWRSLSAQDQTAGLERSGHIYLEVPGGMPAVPFDQLSREFWASISLTKPPTSAGELADDIEEGLLAPEELDDTVWTDLGISGATLTTLNTLLGDPIANRSAIASLIRPLTLTFNRVAADVWLDASDSYDASPVPYALTWFRARLVGSPDEPPEVSRFLLNTVAATAAVTRFEEALGNSDGRPNQVFQLVRKPVLTDFSHDPPEPDLNLVLRLGDEEEEWKPVGDFYGRDVDDADDDDAVFILDAESGTITFGDGVHGRIPVASAQVVAARYRYGGGSTGNAGPGTITALKSSVPGVDTVTNVRAAGGGLDAETLEEAKLRAPHDLRHRDRAVTAEDFADLALQTPGVPIQRAFALALTRADASTSPPTLESDQPGAVTVVILPENKEDTPQPSEEQLRLVCQHLNQRRLITTELYVVGPRYITLGKLSAEVMVSRQADLKAVHEAVKSRLLAYFHPLHGGGRTRLAFRSGYLLRSGLSPAAQPALYHPGAVPGDHPARRR